VAAKTFAADAPADPDRSKAAIVLDELAALRLEIEHTRVTLAWLQDSVAHAERELNCDHDTDLREANELLVLSALRAQSDAEMLAQANDDAAQSFEIRRQKELRAGESLAALNAGLEQRVIARTRDLELARDAALAAVRAKEQFLSSMSHEIRTPMNGMLGALELLANTELNPRQAEYIGVATLSGEALLAVINEVLDFAKIDAGGLRLVEEPIDVNAIARSVTTLFSAAAQRKAIELRLDADPALSGWHMGDALRLRQVLLNLVGNAMKFTHDGALVVRTRRVGDAASRRIAFEVSDSGMGIDPSQHERIFEAFVQADDPARRPQGGTGLGLSISRALVRAMGGELAVTSALGEGATFRFELALRDAPAQPAAPADATAASTAPLHGRVLLVEDNSVNRLVGTAMLEAFGLEVIVAEDGEEALARLADTAFALVLMDCQMPVMDGYEATQRLRESERLAGRARLPVVALTANAFSSDVERCLAAGMDAHLGKPYSIGALRAAIAPWLAAPGADT